jgi:hypothetical protein
MVIRQLHADPFGCWRGPRGLFSPRYGAERTRLPVSIRRSMRGNAGRAGFEPATGVNFAMTTNRNGRAFARPLLEIIEEAIAILRQDASEYALIGLVGAFAACMAVLIPGLIGGPVALSLIAPLLVLIAVGTLAASAAALGVGANQLQPDAGRAFGAAAGRSIGILLPWLPLIALLGTASYVAATFSSYLGPVPPEAVILMMAAAGGFYALPRSLGPTALFEHDLTSREALHASAVVVRQAPRTIGIAWGIVLAPSLIVALLGALAGIDAATGAIIAVLFVGAMPAGAALMSQLFIDAASRIETAPAPAPKRGKPAAAQRRV